MSYILQYIAGLIASITQCHENEEETETDPSIDNLQKLSL